MRNRSSAKISTSGGFSGFVDSRTIIIFVKSTRSSSRISSISTALKKELVNIGTSCLMK